MFSPDETALIDLLRHSFLVRSRHFCASAVVRFEMPLNATRSALIQAHRYEFLALVARVRTNSFSMKRVLDIATSCAATAKTLHVGEAD